MRKPTNPSVMQGPRVVRDVVMHDGLRYKQEGMPVLRSYLARHPQRVQDVMRLVPEAVNGIHTVVRVEDGHLLVTGVAVNGTEDPLRDMVLWHALFPGLRAPLVAWWFTGRIHPVPRRVVISTSPLVRAALPTGGPDLSWWIEQGHVRPSPEPLDDVPAELQEPPLSLPLPVRVLLVPLFLLAVPIGTVMVYRESRQRRHHEVPWWYALVVPVLAIGIVLKLLAPRTFMRHIEPVFDRIGERYRQRQIVQEMVEHALERDTPRSLPK